MLYLHKESVHISPRPRAVCARKGVESFAYSGRRVLVTPVRLPVPWCIQLAAEERLRAQHEEAAAQKQKQLEEALKACKLAREECTRVRRRNETLEREYANLKREYAIVTGTGGEGLEGMDAVLNDLGQMEAMMS